MQRIALAGPGAGSGKYDVLTALSVAALGGSQTFQTSVLRLIALVTARYNWRTNELTVGQRDMARLWSVNERTVKREIKRLSEAGLLVCTRAGVRGRVAAYRLDLDKVAEISAPCWGQVGPDFVARMEERHRPVPSKVIPLRDYTRDPEVPMPNPATGGKDASWARAMTRLAADHPGTYQSWFARLTFEGCADGVLRLRAPSPFLQRYVELHLTGMLLRAAEIEFGPVARVELTTAAGAGD